MLVLTIEARLNKNKTKPTPPYWNHSAITPKKREKNCENREKQEERRRKRRRGGRRKVLGACFLAISKPFSCFLALLR